MRWSALALLFARTVGRVDPTRRKERLRGWRPSVTGQDSRYTREHTSVDASYTRRLSRVRWC